MFFFFLCLDCHISMVVHGQSKRESVCMRVCRLWRALTLSQMWPAVGFHIRYTLYSLDIAQQSSLKFRSVTVTHTSHAHTPSPQSVPLFLSLFLPDVSIATAGMQAQNSEKRNSCIENLEQVNTQSTAQVTVSSKEMQLKYVASITVTWNINTHITRHSPFTHTAKLEAVTQ